MENQIFSIQKYCQEKHKYTLPTKIKSCLNDDKCTEYCKNLIISRHLLLKECHKLYKIILKYKITRLIIIINQ